MAVTAPRRRMIAVAVLAAAVAIEVRGLHPGPAGAPAATPAPLAMDAATARAGFTFSTGVAPPDRAWILAAVAGARPEAQGLIARVDGLVRISTRPALGGYAVGLTRQDRDGTFEVSFGVGELDGRRAIDRDVVVLHELGHVIDAALVPRALAARLDAAIPRTGTCTTPDLPIGACAPRAERFADTFAKWALRGAVSEAGAGYAIPMPASLESWGAPLAALAPGS